MRTPFYANVSIAIVVALASTVAFGATPQRILARTARHSRVGRGTSLRSVGLLDPGLAAGQRICLSGPQSQTSYSEPRADAGRFRPSAGSLQLGSERAGQASKAGEKSWIGGEGATRAATLDHLPLSMSAPVGIGFRGITTNRMIAIMLVGGALAHISWNLEDPRQIGQFLDQPVFEISDLGTVYGDGLFLGAGMIGLVSAARLSGHAQLRDLSEDLSRSLLTGAGAVWALKLSINRRRPSGGPHSFPSGHTAAAFSVAPIIAKHLGWKAAVPAYLLAGITGIARMEDHVHYLSDVVFGAAIGIAAGDMVAGGNRATNLLSRFLVGPSSIGLSLDF